MDENNNGNNPSLYPSPSPPYTIPLHLPPTPFTLPPTPYPPPSPLPPYPLPLPLHHTPSPPLTITPYTIPPSSLHHPPPPPTTNTSLPPPLHHTPSPYTITPPTPYPLPSYTIPPPPSHLPPPPPTPYLPSYNHNPYTIPPPTTPYPLLQPNLPPPPLLHHTPPPQANLEPTCGAGARGVGAQPARHAATTGSADPRTCDPNRHPVTHPNEEDDRDFGFGWNATAPTEPHFDYKSAFKIHGFPYEARLDTWFLALWYGGGGYLVELKGPMSQAQRTVEEMEDEGWIDKHTKAVFTEFAVYNPQVRGQPLRRRHSSSSRFPPAAACHQVRVPGLTLLRYHPVPAPLRAFPESATSFFHIFYREELQALRKGVRINTSSRCGPHRSRPPFLRPIVLYLSRLPHYYTLTSSDERQDTGASSPRLLDRRSLTCHLPSRSQRYGVLDFVREGAESSFFLINKKFDDIANAAPVLGPVFYFVFAFILYWIVFQLLIAIICEAFAQVSKDLNLQANDYEVIEYMTTRLAAYLSALRPNAVRPAHIPPPKPPDVDSLLRHLDHSLDRALDALDRATPKALPEEAEGQGGEKKITAANSKRGRRKKQR
ncbi:hypothetical protein C7M84_015632 [Penaeus vannamei]|uniref:Uncharacterized protein n=1 Tax=Penaeus vannamei TaxID=6689 RepID=A0A423SQ95_PENVA|nr:hypothetical protein C7M84_015632 [Penaeus vannamei]